MARCRGRITIGVAALFGVAGCVSATFVQTGGTYPAKSADCDLQIFSSAVPDRPYEELGIVEGEGDLWKADLEDVMPRLREEACLAGGDGLILLDSSTFAEGENGVRVQRVTATVIRWEPGR